MGKTSTFVTGASAGAAALYLYLWKPEKKLEKPLMADRTDSVNTRKESRQLTTRDSEVSITKDQLRASEESFRFELEKPELEQLATMAETTLRFHQPAPEPEPPAVAQPEPTPGPQPLARADSESSVSAILSSMWETTMKFFPIKEPKRKSLREKMKNGSKKRRKSGKKSKKKKTPKRKRHNSMPKRLRNHSLTRWKQTAPSRQSSRSVSDFNEESNPDIFVSPAWYKKRKQSRESWWDPECSAAPWSRYAPDWVHQVAFGRGGRETAAKSRKRSRSVKLEKKANMRRVNTTRSSLHGSPTYPG